MSTIYEQICDKHGNDQSALLAILQDIQKQDNWLPREALQLVADKIEVPLARIYAMATFFTAFSLEPRGKYCCNVCMGTACHVRGAPRLVERLERDLDVPRGSTTEDMMFSVDTVNCVGACALGPLIIINDDWHGQMDTKKLGRLIRKIQRAEKRKAEAEAKE